MTGVGEGPVRHGRRMPATNPESVGVGQHTGAGLNSGASPPSRRSLFTGAGLLSHRSLFTGTGLLARIAVRTSGRAAALWTLGMFALFLVTGLSVNALYSSPEELASYDASVGESMVALTGRVAGLDTLGGVLMNENSFLVGYGVPLMAIALTAGLSRKEEETRRTELLVAGRVGRLAPTAAVLAVVVGVFSLLGPALWAATFALDVDRGGAALYTASITVTGWVYAAATASLAQVFRHSRTVWAAALTLAGLTLVARGVGDARQTWLSWASPLGWHGLTRPFGDPALLPLVVAAAAAAGLGALALVLAHHRDVGAALLPVRGGPATATRWRASVVGATVHQHLGAVVGWTIGACALLGMYGALLDVAVGAIEGNPGLAVYLGDPAVLVDALSQMLLTFAGFLGAGFALQTLQGLRGEETSGRLESELSAPRSRWAWLAGHALVAVAGTAIVVLVGCLAFTLTAATTLEDPALAQRTLGPGAAQIAAAAVFAGLSVALFGLRPRAQVLAWLPFALAVVVTLLGPTLRLAEETMRLSPFGAVGTAPVGTVDPGGVWVLAAAGVMIGAGLLAFRLRDVPSG